MNRLLARSLTNFLTQKKFSLLPWLQSLAIPLTRTLTHSEIVVPAAFVNCVLVVLLVCFALHTFYLIYLCVPVCVRVSVCVCVRVCFCHVCFGMRFASLLVFAAFGFLCAVYVFFRISLCYALLLCFCLC